MTRDTELFATFKEGGKYAVIDLSGGSSAESYPISWLDDQDSLTTICETRDRPAPCSKHTKCGVIGPPLERACEAQRPGMQSVTLDRYSVINVYGSGGSNDLWGKATWGALPQITPGSPSLPIAWQAPTPLC